MKILGVTGPSGSGKTTLCSLIQKNYNAIIINADNIAKTLSLDSDTEYFKKIVNLFGNEILNDDRNLNRKAIAKIIYNNHEKRKKLNELTFKYVTKEIRNQIIIAKKDKFDYIVIDVPLLYEAKIEEICDKVIAVIAEDKKKIIRICIRDNISKDSAIKRLQIQNDNKFFIKKADEIIYNNGTMISLEKSLKEIIKKI